MNADHARFVWNLGLEQRQMWRRSHRGRRPAINAASQMRELAALRADLDWLRAGSSVVQQAALRDLDSAYQNWWKTPGHYHAPTWRKASKNIAFYIRDLHVQPLTRRWGRVMVPKVGWVKFRLTRPISSVIAATSARVTFKGEQWHVSFTAPPPVFYRDHTGQQVGLDRGVTNTLATSDGLLLHIPAFSTGEAARFLALSQRLSRQQRGSARRLVTKTALAKMHAKLANRKNDWVEQVTTALVRTYDLCAIEDLRTANMVRRPKPVPDPDQAGAFLPNGAAAKAGLNKAIYASCWAKFAARLMTKAEQSTNAATVVPVNPRNTSRECVPCGHVAPENRQSQAVFTCVNCGHIAHADTNAATIILARTRALPQPQDMRGSGAAALPKRKPRQPAQAATTARNLRP